MGMDAVPSPAFFRRRVEGEAPPAASPGRTARSSRAALTPPREAADPAPWAWRAGSGGGEGGGRKGERRRATATETQGGRERAAVTERQSQGKRQRWNQIQSCPSPGHRETAIPQRPRQGRRNALSIPGCFLLPREPYHRLLHNCILTFLNSSAVIYVSTCSIANNSFGEK